MITDEEVLSLDLEENDFLYRIRKRSRIVYVSVLHEDIIPKDCRTDSSRVLSKLRKVPKWDEHWTTLTVRKSSEGVVESTADENFEPHSLDTQSLGVQGATYFNILDLKPVDRISDRVFRVKLGDKISVLKIARFKHEVPSVQQEVSIYAELMSGGFPFAPKFFGYAYEEEQDRTIGFLMENLSGRTPDIEDLEACQTALRCLHQAGIIHGDTSKYNFLVTNNGVKIFDFGGSTIQQNVDSMEAEKELRGLIEKLQDNSGIGKR